MLTAIAVAYVVIVAVIIPWTEWQRYRAGEPARLPPVAIGRICALLATLLLLIYASGLPFAEYGLTIRSATRLIIAISAATAVVIAIDVAALRVATAAFRRGALRVNPEILSNAPTENRPYTFLTLCALAATWEELLFRGVLLRRSLSPSSLLAALMIGTIIFSLQHVGRGPAAALYAFGYGVLFSTLYLMTGELVAVMVAHACGNAFSALYAAPRLRAMQRLAALL